MDIRTKRSIKARLSEEDLGEGNLDGYFCIPVLTKVGNTDYQPDYDFAVGVITTGDLAVSSVFYALDPAFQKWEGRRISAPDTTFLWPLAVSGLTDVVATITAIVFYVTRALDTDTGTVTVEVA